MKIPLLKLVTVAGVLSCGAIFLSGCGKGALPEERRADPTASGKLPRIVVIAGDPGTNWSAARQGALAAGKALGAEIDWKQPNAKSTLADQKKFVYDAIESNASGIVVAPVDPTEMVPPINKGGKKYVPTVVFDSPAFTKFRLTYVASDEKAEKKLVASQNARLANQWDASLVKELQAGKAPALVVPDRYNMAYESVRAIMQYRINEPPKWEIEIAPVVVTKETLQQPEVRKALGLT